MKSKLVLEKKLTTEKINEVKIGSLKEVDNLKKLTNL